MSHRQFTNPSVRLLYLFTLSTSFVRGSVWLYEGPNPNRPLAGKYWRRSYLGQKPGQKDHIYYLNITESNK